MKSLDLGGVGCCSASGNSVVCSISLSKSDLLYRVVSFFWFEVKLLCVDEFILECGIK